MTCCWRASPLEQLLRQVPVGVARDADAQDEGGLVGVGRRHGSFPTECPDQALEEADRDSSLQIRLHEDQVVCGTLQVLVPVHGRRQS